MKNLVKVTFLFCACFVIGYLLEPLCFVHSSSVSEDQSEAQAKTEEVKKPVDRQAEKKVLLGNQPRIEKESAEKSAQVTKDSQEKSVIEVVDSGDKKESEKSEVKSSPFPIQDLKLGQFEKRSITGSLELDKAIRYAIDNRRFEDFAKVLEKEICKPVSKRPEIPSKELSKLLKNKVWRHALNVDTLIHLFSSGELDELASASSRGGDFYYWVLTTPQALTQFLYNLKPQDNLRQAMLIWQDIWESEKDPKIRDKYLNLAIACALVFDTGNIKVKTDTAEVRSLERYTLFRENAERKRLKTVLSNMEVADLVWVVDVPLSDSEIEWAVKRANFSRRRWGKAYGSIEYLMERAVNGENPYDGYTLAQIKKHGGICGDQTYFSVNTAKANGIPAAGVSGSGDRGGHAWLAYKPNKDKWDTSTGRYENYSNGTAWNSQINQKISEFDFILMSDRKMKVSRIMDAYSLLRFASVLELVGHDRLGIRQVFEEALRIAPLLPDAWIAYVGFLEKSDPELTQAEWQKVIDTIERTFKKHPTMWLMARDLTKKHIWKYMSEDQIEKTQSRYRTEIARKFPDRGDLIRNLIKDQAAMVSKKDDFKKMRSFFRQTLRLFGKDTLNFKLISSLYFQYGQKYPENQRQVCDDIENYFSRHLDTESGDYFKAKTEVSMLKTIANYYRKIGEQRKADRYAKEATRRLKSAKKGAL